MGTRGLIRSKVFILFLLSLLFVVRGDQMGVEAQGLVEYSLLQIRIPLNSDPVTLDPLDPGSNISSQFVLNQIFESFFRYSPEGIIEPAGASSYEISGDGLTYSIFLREDAYWSDSTPETPVPVIAQHYMDGMLAQGGSDWDYLLFPIENFKEWSEGTITDPALVGISSVDDYELEIKLETPTAHFLDVLTWFKYPLRMDVPEELRPYVNNGPYRLYEWAPGDYLWLVKNEFYWNSENVQFLGIQLPIIPDLADQLDAYQNGDLDVSGYPPEAYPDILADPVLSAEHHRQPQHGVYYLGLNTTLTHTSDLDLRIALASSIDRRAILDASNMFTRETATGVITPGMVGFQGEDVGYPYNPVDAKLHLETYMQAAGIEYASDIQLVLWTSMHDQDMPAAIAQMWRDNLGVTVDIVVKTWAEYLEQISFCYSNPEDPQCSYNVYRFGWYFGYLDPWFILSDVLHPDSGWNPTHWDNPDYRDLLSEAAGESDETARISLYQQAEGIVVEEDAVIIPIYYFDRTFLTKPYIKFEYPAIDLAPHIMNWSLALQIVTNTNDSGSGSFRQAIEDANAAPGTDLILFFIPDSDTGCDPGTNVCTIQPESALHSITDPVIIDGYTQHDASPNTNPPDLGSNAELKIELDGSNAGPNVNGLHLTAANSTIRGLVINRFDGNGIYLQNSDATRNRIEGNIIGMDANGTLNIGNHGDGIAIFGSPNNTIGGTADESRNLISANGRNGIYIFSSPVYPDATNNNIQGNYIGTDTTGNLPQGNAEDGINLYNATNNTIGGTTPEAGNLISGNGFNGVRIVVDGATGNVVQGNKIGTNAGGNGIVGNSYSGVEIQNAPANVIGGTVTGATNVISGNRDGVFINSQAATGNVIEGNFIGSDVTGSSALGNSRHGVYVLHAPGNTIGGSTSTARNIISSNNDNGIYISGTAATGNVVQGNFIGTDASGTVDQGNSGNGVTVRLGATANLIGGSAPGAGNVISGNDDGGVRISENGTSQNVVQGNLIGTDLTGTNPLGNTYTGIFVTDGPTDNVILANVISDNGASGVVLDGLGVTGNVVAGNFIGTDIYGTSALPNSTAGVWIVNGSNENTIGGTTPEERNVISGNDGTGISIVVEEPDFYRPYDNHILGNFIGTDISGKGNIGNKGEGVGIINSMQNSVVSNLISFNGGNGVKVEGDIATSNRITENSIHDNVRKGIELIDGGNLELLAPEITAMLGDSIEGTAPPGSTVEIFADVNGEGRTFLGSVGADDNTGEFYYSGLLSGPNLTATATDGDGNTSEFSAAVAFAADNCEINDTFDAACDRTDILDFPISSTGNISGTFSSYISRPDDVDWFIFEMPEDIHAGSAVYFNLSGEQGGDLPANFDLVVLAELTEDSSTNPTPLQGVPLQGVPLQGVPLQGVPLQGVDAEGVPLQGVPLQGVEVDDIPLQGVPLQGVPLQGVPLQGVPLQGVPLQGVGFLQGTQPENVLTLFRGGMTGRYYVMVWSSTGEFSTGINNSPYQVTVSVEGITAEDCSSGLNRNLLGDTLVSPLGNVNNPQTLILINRPRMVALYEETSVTTLIDGALTNLTGQNLVQGVVVDLGSYPQVNDAYENWDSNGCDPEAANLVTIEIKKVILELLTTHPDIENLVLVGNDLIIPFRRVPDEVVRTADGATVPNEFDYQNEVNGVKQIGGIEIGTETNPTFATLQLQYYLSDDFYADLAPVLLEHGHELSIPDIPIGRLVETPEDIQAYIQVFLDHGGQLADVGTASSLTTGYSFLSDLAGEIDALFVSKGFLEHDALIDVWDNNQFLDAYITQTPLINAVNAHADHWQLAPPVLETADDLFDTGDLTSGGGDLGSSLLFSVGCHLGLNFLDISAPGNPGAFDFPQALLTQGGSLIGNWGFGYGDDAAIAYSEELMLEFARRLGAERIGQVLVQAKREYLLNQAVMDPIHEKILMEAVFYGLPMWDFSAQVGDVETGVSVVVSQPGDNSKLYSVAVDLGYPSEVTIPDRGTFYSQAGRTQAALFRPIQPQVSIDVGGQPDQVAHGALFTGGTYSDIVNFDPVITMPSWTRTNPEPQFLYEGWDPARFWSLVQLEQADGTYDERLVLVMGQFLVDEAATISSGITVGTQRLYESIDIEVLYAGVEDEFQPPIIGRVNAEQSGSAGVFFSVQVYDPADQDGESSGIERVIVTFTESEGGSSWQNFDLSENPLTGLWENTLPVTGSIDFSIQVVDGSGNVGVFAGNGYFTPVGVAVSGPSLAVVGQPVSFSMVHTLEEPAILWDFGDGSFYKGGELVEHTFSHTGQINVTVRVVDKDGNIGQATKSIEIIEYPPDMQEFIDQQLTALSEYIGDQGLLPDSAIRNPANNRRQELIGKLDEVESMIGNNEINGAIHKLTNDVLAKMDGCPPKADNNDWITACSQQSILRALVQDLIATLEALIWSTHP